MAKRNTIVNLESLRVLIADPERISCQAVARTLRQVGAEVRTVASGTDALLFCEGNLPDVLITEVHLPDFDGFELCERIRRLLRDPSPTIVVTTRPDDEMTQTYLGPMVRFVGGDYFIAKPADPMLVVCLLSDLFNSENQVEASNRPIHPARATWPTSRSYSSVCAG
jgi:CheY-like chemotaxis protein